MPDTWELFAWWQEQLPVQAVFGCRTAAWLHELAVRPTEPIEIFMPRTSTIRSRPALTVRRSLLKANEVTTVRTLRTTTLHRTLRDLALFHGRLEALIALDAALHKKLTDKRRLIRDPVAAKGRRGNARLRRLLDLAEPAESPMETRLRWLLHVRRIPRPEVQVELHDGEGRFVGRADLYYPAARLVVEFDGGNHRDRLVSDDRRQNAIVGAGYRILRFTGPDVQQQPDLVVAQIEDALRRPTAFTRPG